MVSTRPVSWTSAPAVEPLMRDSRIEATSEAANHNPTISHKIVFLDSFRLLTRLGGGVTAGGSRRALQGWSRQGRAGARSAGRNNGGGLGSGKRVDRVVVTHDRSLSGTGSSAEGHHTDGSDGVEEQTAWPGPVQPAPAPANSPSPAQPTDQQLIGYTDPAVKISNFLISPKYQPRQFHIPRFIPLCPPTNSLRTCSLAQSNRTC